MESLNSNSQERELHHGGFEWAFASLFDQDVQTFTGSMLLNLDQLEKQLDKEEFQETGSMDAFRERAKHKREYNRRVNDRMMQSKEGKVISSKALDAGLIVTECSGTKSDKQDTSSSLGNYITHAVDADIIPINDQVSFAEVDSNTTPDSTNMCHRGGEINQNAEKCQVSCPLLDPSFDNMTTEFSIQSPRESAPAKPHHVNAPSSSRNSKKESYGSNDMAHNYYLAKAKKKTQDKNRNLKPREMPSARTHHTPNACRIFNTGGLKWVPTRKTFTSSTTKVDCEPPNGSNEYITNPYECDQTLNVSAGTLNLSAACKKSLNLLKKGLLVRGKLRQLPNGDYREGLQIADMDKMTLYDMKKGEKVRIGIVSTEMELVLEQTQQGISHEVSAETGSIHMLSATPKLLSGIEDSHHGPNSVLQAGNHVKEILLNLNLPDHRCLNQAFKTKKQHQYEHVGPKVTSSQDGKRSQDDDKRLCLVDDIKKLKITLKSS
ncbi:hypothetical protein Tco_0723541 [Tanacetum coccineum]